MVLLAAIAAAALGTVRPSPALQDQDQGPDRPIPHGQDRPPNPAKSPEEAVAAMTVPEGFTVEVVACEPDLVNPVAMTFDERGRIWVTESLEYPRREPGPGRDRVKVIEDTDGDGRADEFTIFADGLNIPSGIAVGHGGVWVANAPDILFYPDADRDLTPDGPPEVVVTGFGRDDTHELPNSLTWGPDGWLYGWNGVFNRSRVEQGGRVHEFTCAIFRIHPETRRFELFCEGTSNPWGIAFDQEGSLFASACVIDHLWHLVETGYYHRQGGPYPPFTWKIESIVDHTHQKRAYCGITYFDSDAYPEQYRGKLYMGNIHGNCINVDSLTRDGATYEGHGEPDFLSANDAWFMPVVQKVGPDGCLYILDWYDRYHCYQDANRDPEGIDRLKGRLYRVRYKDTPRRAGFDLAKSSDEELITLLDDANVYNREIAQRLLTERLFSGNRADLRSKLDSAVRSDIVGRSGRLHALWALVGSVGLSTELHRALLEHEDPTFRAWGVRAAGAGKAVDPGIRDAVAGLAADPSADVRLQVAIAATKIEGLDPVPMFAAIASSAGTDELIPRILWRNMLPILDERGEDLIATLSEGRSSVALRELLPRSLEWFASQDDPRPDLLLGVTETLIRTGQREPTRGAYRVLAELLGRRDLDPGASAELRDGLRRLLGDRSDSKDDPLRLESKILLAYCGDPEALSPTRAAFLASRASDDLRLRALDALIFAEAPSALLDQVRLVLGDAEARGSAEFRGNLLGALGEVEAPELAEVILVAYPEFEPDLKPKAIGLLVQRPAWTKALLKEIGEGEIPANVMNVNQVRALMNSPDPELAELVRQSWGTVREGRNPAREQVIDRMRGHLRDAGGDPIAGRAVFDKVCAQCHQIYGKGQQVGPDITGNGRGSYEQLLSNVLDPSLVIGASYQGTIVATADGRILSGLLEEDSDRRIVLKLQGGEREVIPRDRVEEVQVSPVSLMPENLEEQITPAELADLFAFLCLDRDPADPEARPIDGTPDGLIAPRDPARRTSEGSNE
jgi:putative membrane-bound dehydrogenase-like protein